MRKQEESLQIALARWMRLQWRGTPFRSDFAAGCKLTMGQAVRNKAMQECRAWPDFFVSEARGGYHGLYLELKRDRGEIYLKDGSLSKKEHVQEQATMLERLRALGYAALFACGIDEAMQAVNDYMQQPRTLCSISYE